MLTKCSWSWKFPLSKWRAIFKTVKSFCNQVGLLQCTTALENIEIRIFCDTPQPCGDKTQKSSLLCGAQRPGLSVTPLGVNGHCGPKSGNHGMPNMLPACSSLVWGHASRKLHAGMPHHLYFFKRWCSSSRECTPQNRPPQPKKCKQSVGSSRLAH